MLQHTLRYFAVPLLLLGTLSAIAQQKEITVAFYNALRYSENNVDARHPDFRTIMRDMQPDILVMEEFSSQAGMEMFRDSVLNFDSTAFSAAPYYNGNDLDAVLYFRNSKVDYISMQTYPTQLRDIYHWRLKMPDADDTLDVFGVHFKASSGSSNEVARAAEADSVRKATAALVAAHPNQPHYFIIGGDFNIYGSTEASYQKLLSKASAPQSSFNDVLTLSGTWNSPAYAAHHTQSTRTTQFNGGANGGMDDRFDMIFFSNGILDTNGFHYVPGSMRPYGNDGLRYNNAVNDLPTNADVGQAIADALHYASDHLPIVSKLRYRVKPINNTGLEQWRNSIYIQQQPNGLLIKNTLQIPISVRLYEVSGRQIGMYQSPYNLHIHDLQPGMYIVHILDQQGRVVESQKTIVL
jgi:endonuclease/exonuclease/phosphatase family metal-dependent hydrolase